MTPTYLYTIRAGQSVRVPIDLDAVRAEGWPAVDMGLAEPYFQRPLSTQYKPTRQAYGKHAAMIADLAQDERITVKAWRTELLYEIERKYKVNRKVAGYLLRQARKRKGETP